MVRVDRSATIPEIQAPRPAGIQPKPIASEEASPGRRGSASCAMRIETGKVAPTMAPMPATAATCSGPLLCKKSQCNGPSRARLLTTTGSRPTRSEMVPPLRLPIPSATNMIDK